MSRINMVDVKEEDINDEISCIICMCDIVEKDHVSLPCCQANYHKKCIEKWWGQNDIPSCPMCRAFDLPNANIDIEDVAGNNEIRRLRRIRELRELRNKIIWNRCVYYSFWGLLGLGFGSLFILRGAT